MSSLVETSPVVLEKKLKMGKKFDSYNKHRRRTKYNRKSSLVAQWVGALAPQAEGWVIESQPRQT